MNDKMKEVQRKYRKEIKKRNKSMKMIKIIYRNNYCRNDNCIVFFFTYT